MSEIAIRWAIRRSRLTWLVDLDDLRQIAALGILEHPTAPPGWAAYHAIIDYVRRTYGQFRAHPERRPKYVEIDERIAGAVVAFDEAAVEARLADLRRLRRGAFVKELLLGGIEDVRARERARAARSRERRPLTAEQIAERRQRDHERYRRRIAALTEAERTERLAAQRERMRRRRAAA